MRYAASSIEPGADLLQKSVYIALIGDRIDHDVDHVGGARPAERGMRLLHARAKLPHDKVRVVLSDNRPLLRPEVMRGAQPRTFRGLRVASAACRQWIADLKDAGRLFPPKQEMFQSVGTHVSRNPSTSTVNGVERGTISRPTAELIIPETHMRPSQVIYFDDRMLVARSAI
jgi:hypothetical protein